MASAAAERVACGLVELLSGIGLVCGRAIARRQLQQNEAAVGDYQRAIALKPGFYQLRMVARDDADPVSFDNMARALEAFEATLIRRASFDLTGLPPEPEEVLLTCGRASWQR